MSVLPGDHLPGAEVAPGGDLQDHLEDLQDPGGLAEDRNPDLLREDAAGRKGTGKGGPEMTGAETPLGAAILAAPHQESQEDKKLSADL